MKEKIYKVEVIVTDEETGKQVKGKTFSHWIGQLEEKHSISPLEEIYKQLLKEIENKD